MSHVFTSTGLTITGTIRSDTRALIGGGGGEGGGGIEISCFLSSFQKKLVGQNTNI